VLVFTAEEQEIAEKRGIVKRMFTRIDEKQFYFTDHLLFENNVIEENVHDWAISKILKTGSSKISLRNLDVTIKIAISMMQKAGYTKTSIDLVLKNIRDKATEIIDIKQYEWEKVLKSQTETMPF